MATLAELMVTVGVDDSGFERGMDQAPKHAEGAVSGIRDKFKGLGDKLAPIAKAAGVAAGAAVVAGAVIGIEQEALTDKLAAQLDLNEEDSKVAGELAGRIYSDAYGDSFGEVNDAVGAVISTITDDLTDPSAIEALTIKTLDLAEAFDLNVTDAVTRAGALMESGLAKDADHAMDLVVASLQRAPQGLRDELGDATTEYSKFFGDLGITGEETFGLLASQSDALSLDKAGDAIKELSIRATDMSTGSVEAFETMGLDAESMADKILAGGDTARGGFDEIIDGLLAIEDPTKQANTAIALFGTPLEDLGTAEIPAFLGSLDSMDTALGDVSGAADDMGDILNDNAKTKITDFKRSIEDTLAKVVEMPGILGDGAAAVAGLGQVVAPMGPAFVGMAALGGGSMSKLTGAASAAFSGITKGFGAMMKFVMANPWVLLIAATIALVVLIVKNWDKISAFVMKVWDAIKDAAGAVGSWISDKFNEAVEFVKNLFLNFTPLGLFIKHMDSIKDAVTGVKDWIFERIGDIVGFFRDMPGRISRVIGGLFDGLKNAFRNAVNWVIDKWNNFSLGIDLPGILGGGRIALDTPNIPRLHEGGIFEAPSGQREGLAILESGEEVVAKADRGSMGGNTYNLFTLTKGEFLRELRAAGVEIDRLGWT